MIPIPYNIFYTANFENGWLADKYKKLVKNVLLLGQKKLVLSTQKIASLRTELLNSSTNEKTRKNMLLSKKETLSSFLTIPISSTDVIEMTSSLIESILAPTLTSNDEFIVANRNVCTLVSDGLVSDAIKLVSIEIDTLINSICTTDVKLQQISVLEDTDMNTFDFFGTIMEKTCGNFGCLGNLDTHMTCSVCETIFCSVCEQKLGEDHVECDVRVINNLEFILKHAKKCPGCTASIIKEKGGCDQMFCVECKTSFSWTTGKAVTDHAVIHNPHANNYFMLNPAEGRRYESMILGSDQPDEYGPEIMIMNTPIFSIMKHAPWYNDKMYNIINRVFHYGQDQLYKDTTLTNNMFDNRWAWMTGVISEKEFEVELYRQYEKNTYHRIVRMSYELLKKKLIIHLRDESHASENVIETFIMMVERYVSQCAIFTRIFKFPSNIIKTEYLLLRPSPPYWDP
jgi:hypothetical protein